LRRLPVRRDFYANADFAALRSDPEAQPFVQQDQLIYRSEWTGGIFREMAFIIRVVCLDTHAELKDAWRAINAAPPEARAQALAVLTTSRTLPEYWHSCCGASSCSLGRLRSSRAGQAC
jgi:hypothetical protein